ncbi:hypothetical protein EKE94_11320 [Mesobaculum littorinae]|uniref:Uncharacterized protein n=1 Tax=Mesobaculum littorinae TaxID=2486419 RepID=A0A438AH64_9RHOB|nr:hypothetical protein [Mesobaculum littorinae]RVV98046.1 hypothetical protein EKE94_11320 [Mesobaculum littorinae]
MTELLVTKTRLIAGVWEGRLQRLGAAADAPAPELSVTYRDQVLRDVDLRPHPDTPEIWALRAPIPAEALSDGVQTFMIVDRQTGERVADFAVAAGEALAGDLRAELDLLRSELDLLKRAFRRHCRDTA